MPVASLRLRLLAGLADAASVIAGMAVVIGVGAVGALSYTRVRGERQPNSTDEVEPDDGSDHERAGEKGDERADVEDQSSGIHFAPRGFHLTSQLHAALLGASAGLAVASRNWRSPGFRLVGLRRVDMGSGGSVNVRSALIGVLFDQAWQGAWRMPFRSRVQRQRAGQRALTQQIKALDREYPGDPETRQRALLELYKSNDVNPFGGCGWLLVGPIASHLLLVVSSRQGRTVRDRVTGTVVVLDR